MTVLSFILNSAKSCNKVIHNFKFKERLVIFCRNLWNENKEQLSKIKWVLTRDATEFSSAWLSSDLAQARGLSARLSSAREIFESARVPKIQLGF